MSKENDLLQSALTKNIPSKEQPSKTKIEAVREQLSCNPSIFFAGEVHHYHSPEYGFWTETVDMVIAPKVPEFTAEKLNTFMDGLIQGIDPSQKDDARNLSDGGLQLGKLYFDEKIGKIRKVTTTTIESTEPDVLAKANNPVGEKTTDYEKDIQRRTWVEVYPDQVSAQTIYEYKIGVENQSVTESSLLSYSEYRLTGEQVKALKKQYANTPNKILRRLLK